MLQAGKWKGFSLAIFAAVMWGISGSLGQYLFQVKQINVEWLITVRMLASGILLIGTSLGNKQRHVWQVWTVKKDAGSLLIFSLIGTMEVQYTYFAAIKHSNAATATVLQYVAPVMIAVFLSLKHQKLPGMIEIVAIFMALTGTFLLVTHGDIHTLSISRIALLLGILSAITLVFYTLYPIRLMQKYTSKVVIGWGMLIGGMVFSFVHPPWDITGTFDVYTYLSIAFIIVFATVFAFYAYALSVQYVGAQKTSLLASIEPLSATLLAVFWLHTPFVTLDWIGSACIIATMILLGLEKTSSYS